MNKAEETIILCENVCRTYIVGEQIVRAVKDVSFSIDRGEFVAVVGPSGSGKSTLLNILGALDQPTSGALTIAGKDVSGLTSTELAMLRSSAIGFVFQQFHLLRRLSALENVKLPLHYTPSVSRNKIAIARAKLDDVGLGDRLDHTPAQLSGGQQQRVAIARALVNNPTILLADEPTGALDTATSLDIMQLLRRLNTQGQTVIVVTHNAEVAAFARRILRFRDGQLIEDQWVSSDRKPSIAQVRVS